MTQGRLSSEFRGRTKRFASATVRHSVALPKERKEVRVLGRQLLRFGTSVAAQEREAARASSDAEFCSKLGGAAQEADESRLWLELLREDCDVLDPALNTHHAEASELIAIFVTMINRTRESGEVKSES